MGNVFQHESAHSAAHFGDTRDHWWNKDFLHLIAKRWNFDAIRSVLDVGAGVGHWSMLLASVMGDDVHFAGVDRERAWVDHAHARARDRRLAHRFSFVHGDALRLPFPDASFDMVTCQTLLIHLSDPELGISEMKRVTRPGGLVMAAEPNNLTESLLLDSVSRQTPLDDIVELVRFQVTCEHGKASLGEGDNSLGDRVPGLFVAQGLKDVDVYVNDKATAIAPPYVSDAQRAFVDDARARAAQETWIWDRAETHRYFLAGGGSEETFAAHFARALASRKKILQGIERGTYHGVTGGPFYLVCGRKHS